MFLVACEHLSLRAQQKRLEEAQWWYFQAARCEYERASRLLRAANESRRCGNLLLRQTKKRELQIFQDKKKEQRQRKKKDPKSKLHKPNERTAIQGRGLAKASTDEMRHENCLFDYLFPSDKAKANNVNNTNAATQTRSINRRATSAPVAKP